jgi:hypothetical protein
MIRPLESYVHHGRTTSAPRGKGVQSSCLVNWKVSDMVVTHMLSLCSFHKE